MPPRLHPPLKLDEFSIRFRDETDRSCAVVGAALLEAQLGELFERRLLGAPGEVLGAISQFAPRIKLAYGLAWISDEVRSDLELVRVIRNDFAHSSDVNLSFADPAIASRCRELRVAKVLLDANEHAATAPHPNLSAAVIRAMGEVFESPRQRYEVTVEMLAQYLRDLPADIPRYQGPDLRQELWNLGSAVKVTFRGAGTVLPLAE